MSGAKVHHAGYKEEPTGQRALPLSGACRGRFGGHRSVPHEEAGEDDQKRISPQVSLPYFYFYVMTIFKGPIYDDHASFSAVHREMFVLFSINNSFSSTYTVQGHRGLEPIPAVME